jgi:hypothetical protein
MGGEDKSKGEAMTPDEFKRALQELTKPLGPEPHEILLLHPDELTELEKAADDDDPR